MTIPNIVVTSPSMIFVGQLEDKRLWVEYFVGDIKSSLLMIDFEVEYIGFARARKNKKPARWYDFNKFVRHYYGRIETETTSPSSSTSTTGQSCEECLFDFNRRETSEGVRIPINGVDEPRNE